jgi:hypothetical protein
MAAEPPCRFRAIGTPRNTPAETAGILNNDIITSRGSICAAERRHDQDRSIHGSIEIVEKSSVGFVPQFRK